MNVYERVRRGYKLEVIQENGSFTAKMTDPFGNTSTNQGWSSREIAIQVVQGMFENR